MSAEDFTSAIWETTRDWPLEHGAKFRQTFESDFGENTENALDEIVYFLAFATDYAFWHLLEKTPSAKEMVRNKFATLLEQFAVENNCRPIPAGNWYREGLIWIADEAKLDGDTLTNLSRRFELYGKSLSRCHDRPAGERAAHILAALCGTIDIAFIAFASPLFHGRWNGVKNSLDRIKIKN